MHTHSHMGLCVHHVAEAEAACMRATLALPFTLMPAGRAERPKQHARGPTHESHLTPPGSMRPTSATRSPTYLDTNWGIHGRYLQ